jgi:hypothetical protein
MCHAPVFTPFGRGQRSLEHQLIILARVGVPQAFALRNMLLADHRRMDLTECRWLRVSTIFRSSRRFSCCQVQIVCSTRTHGTQAWGTHPAMTTPLRRTPRVSGRYVAADSLGSSQAGAARREAVSLNHLTTVHSSRRVPGCKRFTEAGSGRSRARRRLCLR